MRAASLAILLTVSAAACASSSDPSGGGRPTIAAAFYPLQEIATAVGGDRVAVVDLVPPGQEAHDYEPTARQQADLEGATVVLYLHGFQSAIDDAVAELPGSVRKVDLSEGIRQGDDPHVWLDPQNMQVMTTRVAEALIAADPPDAASFAAAAAAYSTKLAELDSAIRAGLASCASTSLVTSHDSFGYFARRYGLTVVPIAGINPQSEPTARQLEQVAATAKERHVGTVFFEDNLPADLARTVAAEIGVGTASLDPMESPSKDQLAGGESYLSTMRANLAALRTGLGCS